MAYFLRTCPRCGSRNVRLIDRTNSAQATSFPGSLEPPDECLYQCECGTEFKVAVNSNRPAIGGL
jgi:hypothetical protein